MQRKLRVLSINMGNNGSTGDIVKNVGKMAEKEGVDYIAAYPRSSEDLQPKNDDVVICSLTYRLLTRELTYLTGLEGSLSIFSTMRLIRKIHKYQPDVIHLHNLHGWYLNYRMLFNYIKKHKIRVIWTLHDCWAFTGGCPHFQKTNCSKWKTGCYDCPQITDYPKCNFDNSKHMYSYKKKCFLGVSDLTIVTPSKWLGDLAQKSFLNQYPIKTVYNGIDLNVFQPSESRLRSELHCENKKVILGVASSWSRAKGIDVFEYLAEHLSSDYQVILVGVSREVAEQLSSKIIMVRRTNNQTELAQYYSMADVFVNPTREDTMPLVNVEALACGTPVAMFRTGGCPETINEYTGTAVEKDDVATLCSEVIRICGDKPYSQLVCIEQARKFAKTKMCSEYLKLYESDCQE